jgi:DNA-directed RNA polymerase specialized sigma24 family protein
MSSFTAVTLWLERFKSGEKDAAQQLWEGYFRRMVGLARQRLRATPRCAADAEDVALSAFNSFCCGVENGRFPRLSDRQDLWQVLMLITFRKAADLVKRVHTQKRGQGRVRNATALAADEADAFAGLLSREPDPQFVALLTEEYERRLQLLQDETLRTIATWKMEGWTNGEIAAKLGRSVSTVELKLRLIRKLWEQHIA